MLERYAAIKYFEEIFGFILLGAILLVLLLGWVLYKISEWKERRRKKRERREDTDEQKDERYRLGKL